MTDSPDKKTSRTFAIKADVSDPRAETFAFSEQKTMYGGKFIATGDLIFIFASETGGGRLPARLLLMSVGS